MSATSVIPLTAAMQALALHGGSPVRKTLLPYGRQSVDEADIQAVVDVLRSDWLTTGPKVGEFEEIFALRVGAAHAVSFTSGTAALHAAAFAAGLKPGDEAITTPSPLLPPQIVSCIKARPLCLRTSAMTRLISTLSGR